jgi:pimeloyl-ACP methyl ester carboxylesterase
MHVVVMVPGFAASHLWRRDETGDRFVKLWLSQLDIAWSGISDLDTDAEVSPTDENVIRAGSPVLEVYQPFLEHLAKRNVFAVYHGYDWRADVQTNGQRLAVALDKWVEPGDECSIVAHSMGGLVAAAAMNRLSDATARRLRRVITCGTPWHGSYRALELFGGQHDIVRSIVNLNAVFSRRNRYSWERETLRVVASWPGAYDLLPMPQMMDAYPPGPGQDFRTDGVFAQKNPWFTTAKYEEAIARRPINPVLPDGVTWHNWRGVGRPTAGPSPAVRDGLPDYWFTALFGDGTVPEFSSHAPAAFNAQRLDFNADHEQFLNGSDVLLAFSRLLLGE